MGAETSCCKCEFDVHAEVFPAKHVPEPFDEGSEDVGNLAVEVSSGQLTPIEERKSGLMSPRSGLQRMMELRHMEVDPEVTRGIPLHVALRRSELWTSPDEIRRRNRTAEVWNFSSRVTSFDIFLSHTWRTRAWWKKSALIMQTGWLHGLLAWFLGVATLLCLRGFEILLDPWKEVFVNISGNQVKISLSPWTVLASPIFLVLGLHFSPYVPLKVRTCFLDVACIHLGDADMFERGIYSIGGCLSVAKELRVLYTPEYLSSLWCVFELVGFRKGQPQGKLRFSPLFIERSAMICVLIMWCATFMINLVLANAHTNFRQTNIAIVFLAIFLVPMIFIVHTLRYNYREKLRLISDLNTFEVDKLTCASDFDKAFILSAIESWHGSRQAFNGFVRGGLREELLGMLPSPHLPWRYAALILSSQLAWVLDIVLSLCKEVGFNQNIFRYLFGTVSFFIFWFWFAFNSIFYLSDRSAGYGGTYLLDWLKTLAVAGITFLWTLTGFGLWIGVVRSPSLAGLVCYVAFSMLLPCFILDAFKICRPCQRSKGSVTASTADRCG